jgi:hypothetical protein
MTNILRRQYINWAFSLAWILTNTMALLVGWVAGTFLNDNLWPGINIPIGGYINVLIDNPIQRALVIGMSIGCIVGAVEWLFLRKLSLETV